ncbi:2-hydroxychromene-2-carboxylate isomerase [Ruixingdingia sedimenti]|uniref:2-hydroxychromene-2-carboxylate isomerase n=1 Tax=Ruixingdingia sedimenti TaxID=3073604 RepID=A0ABU1F609_9RHOB|nr:2-hydroxychromene-2-carboxylate isomerase [Xinfangfangia sp. LG-4]MDR5652312.1 2-hydroxychromene-2-carboxylate isomerase [Xinfangfangia sp. LG-4]
MAHVDYYFTLLSPWCYLAGQRLEGIAARHGAGITYKPVDPAGLFARTGGKMLPERHESRRAYRLQELRRWSDHLGMKLDPQPAFFPTNPAPASYAVIAAQTAGGGDPGGLVHAFLRAVWAEGRNIAEDEVIRDLLAAHGFDPALADKGLFTGAETYGRNLEDAVAAGVFGMPFYVVGQECFWGQDRLDFLDRHLAGQAR